MQFIRFYQNIKVPWLHSKNSGQEPQRAGTSIFPFDEAVEAGSQKRWIWEEKNEILLHTLCNELIYHSHMSELDTHFPKMSRS